MGRLSKKEKELREKKALKTLVSTSKKEANVLKEVFYEEEKLILKYHNIIFFAIGIFIAIILLKSKAVHGFIENDIQNYSFIGAYLAGMFYSYAATTIPATAVIAIMGQSINPVIVGVIGGIGSLTSDLLIFFFMRKKFLKEIDNIAGSERVQKFKQTKLYSTLNKFAPIIGGFIIASPLPDELAVVLFSYSTITKKRFMLFSYLYNALGITIVAMIGRAVF